MPLPDPDIAYPITLPGGTAHIGTVHLRAVIDHAKFDVGAYTYASDFDPPPTDGWAERLAPYLFPFSAETLSIGRFCQIGHGARFITSSANHATDGLSAYPFAIFDAATRAGFQPDRRDTIIGHDVWIGYGATILPGAQVGHGAIIGAQAVVRGNVPPYAIVTGNPAQVQRMRYCDDEIARLLELAWWSWPAPLIERARPAIEQGDIDRLATLAGSLDP